MQLPSLKVSNAWAWLGFLLSIALNVFAAWIIVQVVNKPDVELLAPPCAVQKAR